MAYSITAVSSDDNSNNYPQCLRAGITTAVTPTLEQIVQLEKLQLTSLQLLQGHSTTEEEFRENDKLWCIAGNVEIVKEAGDRFSGTTNGRLDKNQETLDKFKPLDVKAVVQYIVTGDSYFGEGGRGAKITVIIDSREVPIATYVRCFGFEDTAPLT
ncbi:MAG TPA: hypothetical protein VF172_03940 [Nitrososphaera sp.]